MGGSIDTFAAVMAKKKRKKLTIGRTDLADFPLLKLYDLPVKIDTGAYSSAMHCSHIEVKTLDDEEVLAFHLLDARHEAYTGQEILATDWSVAQVKSSSGHLEERYVIQTSIALFGKQYEMDLSLTDRADMRYPVLLGRKLLKGRFVVDVSKKNLSEKHLKREEK